MIVRKLRLERGWSQEQLAQLTGLNIRTIQRIESGHKAGLESLNALAAVFEVELSQLNPQEQPAMSDITMETTDTKSEPTETYNAKYARAKILILGARFALIICLLFGINFATSPDHIWAWWPALGISIAFAFKCVDKLIIDRLKSQMNTKP